MKTNDIYEKPLPGLQQAKNNSSNKHLNVKDTKITMKWKYYL